MSRQCAAVQVPVGVHCKGPLEPPSLRRTGRLWSIQGLPSAMPHGVAEAAHSRDFSFLSGVPWLRQPLKRCGRRMRTVELRCSVCCSCTMTTQLMRMLLTSATTVRRKVGYHDASLNCQVWTQFNPYFASKECRSLSVDATELLLVCLWMPQSCCLSGCGCCTIDRLISTQNVQVSTQ